jgi:PAS domain S-box-containing protein
MMGHRQETEFLLQELDRLRTRVAILEQVDAERQQIAEQLREETHITETLNRIGTLLAGELDLQRLMQVVTDETTRLTGAQFGALFYNARNEQGESYTLYTLSGVSPAAFEGFPMPRNTAIFGPTFRGEGVIRLDDVTQDPRYGQNAPFQGMPEGHLPVRSYLAVPVKSRSGAVLGGLFFGHPRPRRFKERDERLVAGIAAQAAIAIDNAQLFREVAEARAHYGSLFHGAADAIVVTDSEGCFLDVNPAAVRLFGYSDSVLRSMRMTDLAAQGAAWAIDDVERLLSGTEWNGEIELRRADGIVVPVEVRTSRVNVPDGMVFVAVMRDISERRTLEQMQREFTALVTHELKAPLTSLKGFAQLLHRRRSWDGRSVEVILDRAIHLERLISDLLDVASMDAGRLELRRFESDLRELVEDAVDEVRELTKTHTISAELPDEPLYAVVDPHRVTQVLENLLTNAIKYSPAGSTITITLRAVDDDVEVGVQDTGIGIAAEAIPSLFSRFFRVETVHMASVQGLGLGLYISRTLVEAHGGRIWAESTPGEGSRFAFTLPRS